MALSLLKESQTFQSVGGSRIRRIANKGSDGKYVVYWRIWDDKKGKWDEVIDPDDIKKLEAQRAKAQATGNKRGSKT